MLWQAEEKEEAEARDMKLVHRRLRRAIVSEEPSFLAIEDSTAVLAGPRESR